ncbi:MAG: LLM class flavin-dependent oxidoreductase [Albidovulum sp.]|uniref:LLM class flavin-dependent oxidoreductase n=1 Tax=Albidovulum sp. TaxID=1872424 RepID=UPI00132BA233|nr:LLM class flavin-dependent oxidoreductase [Defluviimonas sp.]KAB2883421.1 MAG: LLM class flavin-dependent oxidoreductase [Defluviimonas sp.]
MIRYSLLDLAPVPEGRTTADALRNTLDLARHAERWGFHRYWLAEHHNMPGIASAATTVVMAHVACATETIRVGAGGIMLPNHAPLVIAEQFGTLATLHPGRIDLGIGRAPGTDMVTARALRRSLEEGDGFPNDVVELIGYLGDPPPDARVRAIPGAATHVPVWILGSSLYGAQLAAHLGLPYAFASHFAPDALSEAMAIYRSTFRPSQYLEKPHCMMAINVFAAPSDGDGHHLKTSVQQAFANLRSGRPGLLPPPVDRIEDHVDAVMLRTVEQALSICATGSPETVRSEIAGLLRRYAPDEIILTGQIHDHAARLRSFEIAADVMSDLAEHAVGGSSTPSQ